MQTFHIIKFVSIIVCKQSSYIVKLIFIHTFKIVHVNNIKYATACQHSTYSGIYAFLGSVDGFMRYMQQRQSLYPSSKWNH